MGAADHGKQDRSAKRNRKAKQHFRQPKKSVLEQREGEELEARLQAEAPARGTNPLSLGPDAEGYAAAREFHQLPLSKLTLEGLAAHNFKTLTAIQRAALPHALAGRDVLGAAKTGSGKTLCFIIPVVEKLFRARWTRLDGLGALILTPTRELALQIFQELRKVGTHHELSAGLLIGGKAVKEEAVSLNRMNILVATPGRLLQHMDETPGFDASSLQILVLDEADRVLDMGFAPTLDAILDNLPREGRQTLLFSATQTKSVKDLARLSLTDPEYLAVHAEAEAATPVKLQQAVAIVEAHQKMDTLWSFIKAHLAAKTIVFLSTCKQVRFFHEAFRRLRPGVPLRALHGGMKQMKRMAVFQEFCQAEHMVLFATDIAGRGLDFPSVDWVLQVDCPEDVAAYIHRVGRTARYTSAGRALLLLTPAEAPAMLTALSVGKVPVKPLRINPASQQPISPALQALLSRSVELKEFAQRALVSYVRSLVLAPSLDGKSGGTGWAAKDLPVEELALSWGLMAAPRMRFLKRVGKKKQAVLELGGGGAEVLGGSGAQEEPAPPAQAQKVKAASSTAAPSSQAKGQGEGKAIANATAKQQEKQGVGEQPGHREAQMQVDGFEGAGGSDDDSDLLVVRRKDVFADGESERQADDSSGQQDLAAAAKGAGSKKKLKIKVGRVSGQRVVFDGEGNAQDPLALLALEGLGGDGDASGEGDEEGPAAGLHVTGDAPEARFKAAADAMRRRDKMDKEELREAKRALKLERKAKARAAAAAEAAEAAGGVSLRPARGGDGSESESGDGDDEDEEGRSGGSSDPELGSMSDVNEGGGGSSDDDDEEEEQHQQLFRKRPRDDSRGGGDDEQPAAAKRGPATNKGQPLSSSRPSTAPTLVDQEALALQLLRSRRV